MQRVLIAHHEAGHVVAHLVLGIPFESVDLTTAADGTLYGHVTPVPEQHGTLWEEAVANLAGYEAHRLAIAEFAPEDDFATLDLSASTGAADDEGKANHYAATDGFELDAARSAAADLIASHWGLVRLVGEALERAGHLGELDACLALGARCPAHTHVGHGPPV